MFYLLVSKWVVNSDTLQVTHGEDVIKKLFRSVGGQWQQVLAGDPALTLGRLCSADLPPVSAYFDAASGLGTTERIFVDGEETGDEGRALGHVATGQNAGSSYLLPSLGKFSWENVLPKPAAGTTTVVAGLDDSTPGQVYVYVGAKKGSGTAVDKAGLTGGQLYGLKIDGVAAETNGTTVPTGGARFSLVPLNDVSSLTGAQLQANSVASGVSNMNRP